MCPEFGRNVADCISYLNSTESWNKPRIPERSVSSVPHSPPSRNSYADRLTHPPVELSHVFALTEPLHHRQDSQGNLLDTLRWILVRTVNMLDLKLD